MKIKFGKNELPYMQDFGMHRDIPTDVIFQTEKDMDKNEYFLRLTADGYGFGVKGQPLGNYGNGAISVSKNDLLINRHQWQIVEEEKKEETLSDKIFNKEKFEDNSSKLFVKDAKEANIKFIDWIDKLRKSYRLTAEAPKGELIRQKANEIYGGRLI